MASNSLLECVVFAQSAAKTYFAESERDTAAPIACRSGMKAGSVIQMKKW